MSDTVELQRVFPQEVHDSLAELRRIARAAKSKDDPGLRRATADELALAETLRKPHSCIGHSNRTGLPCTRPRNIGTTVCRSHGGSAPHIKQAAKARLAELTPGLINSMAYYAMEQRENPQAAVKAGADLLDRAGIGALVQAKVRASRHQQSNGAQVVVNIGFLG